MFMCKSKRCVSYFSCAKYNIPLNDFQIDNLIFRIENIHVIATNGLLWGDNSISIADNENLFFNVQLFFKRYGRF